MFIPSTSLPSIRSQSGVALLVSLIILMVISLLGISSMQSSNLQMKMASTNKERQSVFALAEAGLRRAEEALQAAPPLRNQMYSECANNCYNAQCTAGLCFSGTYSSSAPEDVNCILGNTPDLWSEPTLWNTPTRHQTIQIADRKPVKYITEFICFTNKPAPASPVSTGGVGHPIFRITALAQGDDERVKVMLQSIFSLNNI